MNYNFESSNFRRVISLSESTNPTRTKTETARTVCDLQNFSGHFHRLFFQTSPNYASQKPSEFWPLQGEKLLGKEEHALEASMESSGTEIYKI